MAMTIHIDIVSAEAEVFSGLAEMVFAPAEMGEIGIAPRHTPLLTRLRPGEIRLKIPNGEDRFFYVSGGLLEVQPHIVTVLADTALRARDIDEAAVLEAKQKAEEALSKRKDDVDFAKIEIELAQAIAQLKTVEALRKYKK